MLIFCLALITIDFPICVEAGPQYARDIAFDGSNFMVIWEDHRASSSVYQMYGSRVTPGGSVLDPGGNRFASQYDTVLDQSIAWGNNIYLVAYRDQC